MEQELSLTDRVRELLQSRFADAIISEDDFRGQQSFYVRPEAMFDICQALVDDSDLDVRFLADITAVDWYGDDVAREKGRFEVVYNLYSLRHRYRFFLKAHVPEEKPEIQSLTALFNGANWLEREVYDLMGVVFVGHPDLKKILTPDELEGHPLRRDYPLTYEQPQFTWNLDDPPEVIR